jgi:hypothetical protein
VLLAAVDVANAYNNAHVIALDLIFFFRVWLFSLMLFAALLSFTTWDPFALTRSKTIKRRHLLLSSYQVETEHIACIIQ